MNEIVYPTKELLLAWIKSIETDGEHYLKPYLPKVDNEWADRVMNTVHLIRLEYYPKELHAQGALLFYKINKAHNEIDSNKRTAIIVTFLFYLLNRYILIPPEQFRLMAKRIAKSKGRRNQDSWLKKIELFLSHRAQEF